MKHGLRLFSWQSIRTRVLVCLLLVTLPLIVLLLYNSYYSINVVRNQVADSNRNMLTLYMDQIDRGLEDVDQYLNSLVAVDTDLLVVGTTSEQQDYYMAKISLSNTLSQSLAIYRSIDGFFVYAKREDDFMLVPQAGRSFEERSQLRRYMEQQLQEGRAATQTKKWTIVQLDDDYYLYHIFESGDAYIGAWVSAQRLTIALGLIDMGEDGRSLLIAEGGQPMTEAAFAADKQLSLDQDMSRYYMTGAKSSRYLMIGSASSMARMHLVAAIPDEKILENLPYLRQLTAFVAIGSIIILPLGLWMFRRQVLSPLHRILYAMKRVREGNLEVRIKPLPSAEEFQLVNDTFNMMVADIQKLRIEVYEEQLSKQKAELQHLQLQINPHFFLNSLNIMYSLAQVKNYGLIQELSLCLVNYFRYMFRSNLSLVTLKQELEHVRNYLRIQELRFPGSLTSQIDAPDYVLQSSLPPLAIQTFVENTIKYEVTLDEPLHIHISADLIEQEQESMLLIRIEDTGGGFSDEVLEKIRTNRLRVSEQGNHVGLWNVSERLRLLYEGRAALKFANAPSGGAVVHIYLPLDANEDDGEGVKSDVYGTDRR